MPGKIFQELVYQTGYSIGRKVGVVNNNSVIIACSDAAVVGRVDVNAPDCNRMQHKPVVMNGYTYEAFGEDRNYVAFVEGEDSEASTCAVTLAISLEHIKSHYDEKYDKATFVRNVVLENILPGDVYVKAKEFHFDSDTEYVCILVKVTNKMDVSSHEIIRTLFPDKNKDFVMHVNSDDVVLVKEVSEQISIEDIESLAASIVDTMSIEFYAHCIVGIGTVVKGITDLSRSYKEAQVALEVAKVFDTERAVTSYDDLGIARLVYQLPTTLCEMFLKEVFKKSSVNSLDSDTLFTITKFFENNLNVSETSRKLFIHRNTLVYRLEKIKRLTGLDLRDFEDAIVFKVALMVRRYLDAKMVEY